MGGAAIWLEVDFKSYIWTMNSATTIACNLNAFDAAERTRYNELVKRVRDAIGRRTEVSDGYAFELDGKRITLPETAEWMGMERLCCPFLTLQLRVTGTEDHWLVTLTGPAGAKALLAGTFLEKGA